jgi:kynurenine formamidase
VSDLRFVDLSVTIQNPVDGEVEGDLAVALAADIRYQDHEESLPTVTQIFGCKVEDLPDGLGWANEFVTLSTHAGTHMDSPWHYFPTCEGEPSKRIDEVPLEECFGPGVVLDLRGYEPGDRVGVEAVQQAVEATGAPLAPGDIVLLRFGYDASFGTAAYWTQYPGLTAEATTWICEQGVKVIGTDAVGFDRDFPSQAADFAQDGDISKLWESHRVGMTHEYFQIEKLANLGAVPARGFQVATFPIKVAGASAAWVRPVAILGLEVPGA